MVHPLQTQITSITLLVAAASMSTHNPGWRLRRIPQHTAAQELMRQPISRNVEGFHLADEGLIARKQVNRTGVSKVLRMDRSLFISWSVDHASD